MGLKAWIPDWLTASRVVIALAILALIPVGPQALTGVLLLLLLGWTTDIADGRLARRWDKGPTWIGEHEFHIEMLMVLGSTIYLIGTGLVPALPSLAYLAGAAAISLAVRWRTQEFLKFKSVTMLLAFPWVFIPFAVAYMREPVGAYIGAAWMVLALVLDWRRFLGVVGDFLSGARAFLRRS